MSATTEFQGRAPSWVPDPAIAPVRARIARALFLRAARVLGHGSLTVVMPDGAVAVAGRRDAPTMTIHREAFFHRLATDGRIGFGEAYMAGD
jgi:cyclopropane-fatty-acyl-phospholipid synthase